MPDHRIVLTYDPDGTLVDRVRAALPHRTLEIVLEPSADALPAAMLGTTILFGNYLPEAALRQAGDLRWIQTVGAGVDVLLSVDLTSTDILVTNTSGAFGVQIAEHALSLMFALARRLPGALRSQATRRYAPEPRDDLFELTGKTLGIVGFGDVGQALARRARGIAMRVIAMRRSPEGSRAAPAPLADLALDPLAGSDHADPSALADEVLGPDRLDDLLRESDVVVNAAPLTPATVRLFGREQFARMRSTRLLHQHRSRRNGRSRRVDRRPARRRHRRGGTGRHHARAPAAGVAAVDAAQRHPHRPTTPAGPTPCSTASTPSSPTTSAASTATSPYGIGWTCMRGIDQPRPGRNGASRLRDDDQR